MAGARAGYDAIADELLEVDVDGAPMWLPKGRGGWLDEPPDEGPG